MNKRIIKVCKLIAYLVATSLVATAGLWAYQEYTNRNEYSYFSLWDFKTREKVFEKGDSTVYLVGMIHLATKDYYENITKTNRIWQTMNPDKTKNVDKKGITLMEGITNNREVAAPPKLDYARLVQNLSLTSQGPYVDDFPNVTLADIDLSDFSKASQEELNNLSGVFENFILFLDKKITYTELSENLEKEQQKNPQIGLKNEEFNKEILHKRNDYLWSQIKKSQAEYEFIIVPWGAEHLSDIETRLRSEGYSQINEREYTALNVLKVSKEVLLWVFSNPSKEPEPF